MAAADLLAAIYPGSTSAEYPTEKLGFHEQCPSAERVLPPPSNADRNIEGDGRCVLSWLDTHSFALAIARDSLIRNF